MPTSPIVTHGAAGDPIFGRERELARLDELVDGLPERGAALLVRGEAGIGKSALLAAVSRRAEEARMRVLRTTGVQSEAQLPFAGLHRLVLQVLDHADRLPGPQQTALLGAFGMTEAAAPDRFLIALAVLELLSDAAERAPLLVAALYDGESLSETLEAASSLGGRELTVEHVAPAVSAQLVDADETGLRFRHPLVRTAIHQAADMPQRHAAHAMLVAALDGQPDRSVWHRAASIIGPDEEVASELEAAATRARRRRGIIVSVAALERAAQLTDAPARRGGRLLRAAELAFEQGRHDLVVRLLNDAEPLALDSADRTRLLWLRELLEEHLWSRATRVEDSVALAEQVQRDGAPDRALDFLMTVALKCWRFNPQQETCNLVVAAAEGLPIAEDDPKLLAILAFADPVRCGGMILQRISSLPTDVRAEPEATRLLGTTPTVVGAFDRSTQFLVTSTDDLRAQGRLGLLPSSLVSQARSAGILGTFTDAEPAAEEAERLARETEQPRWAAGAQLACATLAGLRGEADAAEALAAQAERVLLPTGSSSMLALVQIARGVTALGAGHFEDAYEHLRRVFDPADVAFHPVERSWVLLDLVDAAVHSGHHDEARALVGELDADCADPLAGATGGAELRPAAPGGPRCR